LSEIGIVYRNARSALEKRHDFRRRGLVARPIEVKGERNIPQNIKGGRHPKQFFLHAGRNNGTYYGQILSLPIIFYEQRERQAYDTMIDDMHRCFSDTLEDRTSEIVKRIRGEK
jgi:hypothetical protein